ncbi:xanthine dehydrogenase family protein molybdopterin-binding subunit [Muricoccus aerilatus]|uniref:xanthine dehydrogenase family protein molybdopterin-binding subunit n=1 Tax=Muricoccus aerilatus TaxID=452982 RepID=UPI000694E3DF|nr:molybdopterin cofactor-binding domain-containing protein [Roseomonas aerilata]
MSASASLTRRGFGLGVVAAGLAIGFRLDAPARAAGEVTPMLLANPKLDTWVRVTPDGRVSVTTGRVELGQGVLTAMRQIAAHELDIDPAALEVLSADTAASPNEGFTAGSMSVRYGGEALGMACADLRATLLRVAAEAWGSEPGRLTVEGGVIHGADGRRMTYGDAASRVSLVRPVDTGARRKDPTKAGPIGASLPRTDLPAKVFGQQVFIHDLRPEGMLFGAVARPPGYAARLISFDEAAARAMPGVVEVVRDGSFLGVLARREEQAREAASRIAEAATWENGPPLFGGAGVFDYMKGVPAEEKVLHRTAGEAQGAVRLHRAEYRRGFQAHASIGASCALAQWEGGKLTVWSHCQGPFPLRTDLARALRVEEGSIRVIHAQGSGCYGHNGADDVALDAALLARAAGGRPVRVQWTHEEEMAWEPWSSAMIVRMEAGIGGDGTPTSWSHDVRSFSHNTRPGQPGAGGCNLRSAWYLENPVAPPVSTDAPLPAGAAARNAVPIYAGIPNQRISSHFLPEAPIRTSALRTLGGYFNALCGDLFIEELAALAGKDPVSYRLANLTDPRLAEVLHRAVRLSGWTPEAVRLAPALEPVMTGTGLGLSRYKNTDCYVAVVARVEVDTRSGEVRPLALWAAVDAGRVVNPDGLRNQVEGGMVQSTSWTLMEEGHWNAHRIVSDNYADYPILEFPGLPRIESAIVDRPDQPPLGAGEGSQAPTGAAIANAVLAATGRRVPEIPLTPERVRAALLA